MIDIENSRPFDVHRWSEFPVILSFSNELLNELFPRGFPNHHSRKIREKALRVMLLELFCAWHEDPEQSLGISLGKTSYNRALRYNKLELTCSPIKLCFDALLEKQYIEVVIGDRRQHRVTRMRSSEQLIERFTLAQWDIDKASNKIPDEVIVVNISKGKTQTDGHRQPKRVIERDVDYRESAKSQQMRADLEQYNDFINHFEFRLQYDEQEVYLNQIIPHTHLQLHRIFSNKSLTEGGRFYGRFQNMYRDQRPLISIDGTPTIEIDFSSFHPTLAYAKAGVDFYTTSGRDDLYMPEDFGYDTGTYATYRSIVKILFNTLLNARSERSAAHALYQEILENYTVQDAGLSHTLKIIYPRGIIYGHITRLIDWIKGQHPALEHLFCQDLGRHFMFVDSQITNRILTKMIRINKPVLPVHDSYICKEEDQYLLQAIIKESYEEEMQAQGWSAVTFKTKIT